MDDLISRQALCKYALNQKDKAITPNEIIRFPSAEPKTKCIAQIRIDKDDMEDLINEKVNEIAKKILESKTGKWVEQKSDHVEKIYLCSNCKNYKAWGEMEKTPYCPNCGARMKSNNE